MKRCKEDGERQRQVGNAQTEASWTNVAPRRDFPASKPWRINHRWCKYCTVEYLIQMMVK